MHLSFLKPGVKPPTAIVKPPKLYNPVPANMKRVRDIESLLHLIPPVHQEPITVMVSNGSNRKNEKSARTFITDSEWAFSCLHFSFYYSSINNFGVWLCFKYCLQFVPRCLFKFLYIKKSPNRKKMTFLSSVRNKRRLTFIEVLQQTECDYITFFLWNNK